MHSIEEIKKALKEEDLKVLKSLGQNFLTDEKVLDDMVKAADLKENDVAIEIGPGMGVLTFELAKIARKVIAIEKDRKMSGFLRREIEKIPEGQQNIEILNEDILGINLPEFLREQGIAKYKVVANIPYYITSMIIKLFLETQVQPEMMTLLVQKEVAERICAGKGDMSVLALSVLLYGNPEIVRVVGKDSFYPVPKVNSAILKINNIEKKYLPEDYAKIFRLIKIGFSSKRKKLANNLSAGLKMEKEEIENILSGCGIAKNARAQDLEVADWIRFKDAVLE